MTLLGKIFHQAEKTFAIGNKELLKSNILILRRLIDQLEIADLFDPYYSSKICFEQKNKAPCTFINICERERYTLTVFILRGRYQMPLHDHPKMLGILKCVAGKLKISSYTKISNNTELLVKAEEPKIIDDCSSSIYLDENNSNFHEITALDEPAAFFDVLSPPYKDIDDVDSESRQCHFYKKLMVDNDRKIVKLEQIECPSHYYCDSLYFEKPEFMR